MLYKGSNGVGLLSNWQSSSKLLIEINSDSKLQIRFTRFIKHIEREYQRIDNVKHVGQAIVSNNLIGLIKII